MSFNSKPSNNFTFPGDFRCHLTTKHQRTAVLRSLDSVARGSALSFQALGLKNFTTGILVKNPIFEPKNSLWI